jgi:uncharacterized protein YaaR (DUF327 family)
LTTEVTYDLNNPNLDQNTAGSLLLAARTLNQTAPGLIGTDIQRKIDAKLSDQGVHIATVSDGITDIQKPFSRGLNVVQPSQKKDLIDKDAVKAYVDNVRDSLDAFDKNPTAENYKFLKPIIQEFQDDRDSIYKRYKDYDQNGLIDTYHADIDRFNNIASKYGYEDPSYFNRVTHPIDSRDLRDGVRTIASPVIGAITDTTVTAINDVANGLLNDPKLLFIAGVAGLIALKTLMR